MDKEILYKPQNFSIDYFLGSYKTFSFYSIPMKAEEHIFKSIDIRGIYKKDLDEDIMERIGLVVGTYLKKQNMIVSSDSRLSSKQLRASLAEGLRKAGVNTEDVGEMPVGVASFYGWMTKKPVGYITASHMSKEWNGVKLFHEDGRIFHEPENLEIKKLFFSNLKEKNKPGIKLNTDKEKIFKDYEVFIKQKTKFSKKIRVAFDFGNGAAAYLKNTLNNLPLDTVFIYDEPDGNFPNRDSNPQTADLSVLKAATKNCDIGFAFDGDGDRIVVVDDKGRELSTEHFTITILSKLFMEHKGNLVANVECSNILEKFAQRYNRKVHRVKVGHTFMVDAVDKENACFGVEKSGHCTLPSTVPFYDVVPIALYTIAIVSESDKKLSAMVDELPKTYFGREVFACDYTIKGQVTNHIQQKFKKEYTNVINLDGSRVDFEDGWVLIRVSNTEPIIRLSVEAQSKERLEELKDIFREKVKEAIVLFS